MIVQFLTICIFLTFTSGQDLQCFVPGECTDGLHLDSTTAENEFSCLDNCKANSNCTWFTYYPGNSLCNILSDCGALDTTLCPDCISGEQRCTQPEPTCWITGECIGQFLHAEIDVPSQEDCLNICKEFQRCNWFTYIQSSLSCLLFSDCQTLDETCLDCISGESRCTEPEDEPAWHLIFGGLGPLASEDSHHLFATQKLSSVELFNWQTREHCQLNNLPYGVDSHSGTVLDGIPVFCGGYSLVPEKRCYHLNKATYTWEQISDLIAPSFDAGNVLVPSRGWYIFEGEGNTLTTAQKLTTLDGNWETGPNLYQNKTNEGHCLVQINDTTTGLLGGINNKHGILTFDWTTMNYTMHSEELSDGCYFSSCTLLKGINGENLVAIAGGVNLEGLKVWNPDDGSVKFLTTDFPPGVQGPAIISINKGEDLIFYEASYYTNETQKGIWRYFQSNNTWTKIGEMLFPRYLFVALPVTGMSCP